MVREVSRNEQLFLRSADLWNLLSPQALSRTVRRSGPAGSNLECHGARCEGGFDALIYLCGDLQVGYAASRR